MWQVVEKSDYATDWSLVRYNDQAMGRFANKDDALEAARKYVTDINCNNALAKDEKRHAAEVFMVDDKGCFLGVLDGEDWYMLDRHNELVDAEYYELKEKTQVAVRPVPGT